MRLLFDMLRHSAGPATWLLAGAALLAVVPAPSSAGPGWAPIPPEELAAREPEVDPTAGAEVLLWQIRVEDEIPGFTIRTIVRHEIRTKVFDARGVDQAGRVEIIYRDGTSIEGIEARTVRPDGSTAEVRKGDIFDRTVVRASGAAWKAKAFAFPDVTPGCVLEHRWSEIRHDENAAVSAIELQLEYPVRVARIDLRPLTLEDPEFRVKVRAFNTPVPDFALEYEGTSRRAELRSLPARAAEPYMPPTRDVTPWLLVYYVQGDDPPAAEIWKRHAASVLRPRVHLTAVDRSITAMARTIAALEETPEARADRLYDWCRETIEQIPDAPIASTGPDPKKRTAANTLKRRKGTAVDIVHLFVAMCRSLGIETRLTAMADRRQVTFDPAIGAPQLLDAYGAAVRSGGSWRFYEPGARWIPAGSLPWYREGQKLVVLHPEGPEFVEIPVSPPESSVVRSAVRLRLEANGDAVGSIRVAYSGHADAAAHASYGDRSPAGREEVFRERTGAADPGLGFDSVRIEGAEGVRQSIVEVAEIRATGFAQAAGQRLLVPLTFFERKSVPLFPNPGRRYPVVFAHAWSRIDSLVLEVPEGYEVEAIPEPIPPVTKGASRYESSVLVSADGRRIVALRRFSFGHGGLLRFQPEHYASLKRLFDGIGERDRAVASLKRKP